MMPSPFRNYDAWVTREPPWFDGPEYTWEIQGHCVVCGCWLPLDGVDVPIYTTLRCDGPNTEVYGPPVAGWIYTPCETDCKEPHNYEDIRIIQFQTTCRRCGTVNIREEF